MQYKIVLGMTERFAKQIAKWHYQGEYAIYNLPTYKQMVEKNYSIANKQKSKDFICFVDKNDQVVGYIKINKKPNCIFMGIGLAPCYTGQGMGKNIIKLGVAEIEKMYPKTKICLEVRSWNQRAIKCYLSCGFEIDEIKTTKDRFCEEQEFVFMSLKR